MAVNFSVDVIRRSRLIMPVNEARFVKKAYTRNADAIVLDLEDSVPESEKLNARKCLTEAIPLAAMGGSDVIVRVNNERSLLEGDIAAALHPLLDSLYIPKVESAEQIQTIDALLNEQEERQGLPVGQVKLGLIVETVKGYLNLDELANASTRIDSLTLGAEDFSVDAGIEISEETEGALLIPRMKALFLARAYGKLPLGLLSSIADFKNLELLQQNAVRSYKHGFLGASCIHPSNVEILNKAFSPSEEDYQQALQLTEHFERSLAEGRASTTFEGKMIDYPHYKKAKDLITRHMKILSFEQKKEQRREAVKRG